MPVIEDLAHFAIIEEIEVVRLVDQQCNAGSVLELVVDRCGGHAAVAFRFVSQLLDHLQHRCLSTLFDRTYDQKPRRVPKLAKDVRVQNPKCDCQTFLCCDPKVLLHQAKHQTQEVVAWDTEIVAVRSFPPTRVEY